MAVTAACSVELSPDIWETSDDICSVIELLELCCEPVELFPPEPMPFRLPALIEPDDVLLSISRTMSLREVLPAPLWPTSSCHSLLAIALLHSQLVFQDEHRFN